jgi:hypothetical protein
MYDMLVTMSHQDGFGNMWDFSATDVTTALKEKLVEFVNIDPFKNIQLTGMGTRAANLREKYIVCRGQPK